MMVGRNESWVNVYRATQYKPLNYTHWIGCVTAHCRLDKFRMILLELRARHRQSPCVLG